MSNDLITIGDRPLTALDIRAKVNLIQEVMQAVMKKDIHYGTIPGTNKPTLYKAGSEKILATFRIAVELEVEDLSIYDCFRYRVKARGITPSGEIVGCGIGECSTEEEKYKWRGVVNTKEWEATPEDRKRIKYTKIYKPTDTGEIQQIRTNPADLANTALKMAKKRAQIDLTLTATGASDVFDQDIEDLPEEYRDGMNGNAPPVGKPEVKPPQKKQTPPPTPSEPPPATAKPAKATQEQCDKLLVLLADYCEGSRDDMEKVLYECSHFADKQGNDKFLDLASVNVQTSGEWVGGCIGNIEKYIAANPKDAPEGELFGE